MPVPGPMVVAAIVPAIPMPSIARAPGESRGFAAIPWAVAGSMIAIASRAFPIALVATFAFCLPVLRAVNGRGHERRVSQTAVATSVLLSPVGDRLAREVPPPARAISDGTLMSPAQDRFRDS